MLSTYYGVYDEAERESARLAKLAAADRDHVTQRDPFVSSPAAHQGCGADTEVALQMMNLGAPLGSGWQEGVEFLLLLLQLISMHL